MAYYWNAVNINIKEYTIKILVTILNLSTFSLSHLVVCGHLSRFQLLTRSMTWPGQPLATLRYYTPGLAPSGQWWLDNYLAGIGSVQV